MKMNTFSTFVNAENSPTIAAAQAVVSHCQQNATFP